MMKAQLSTGLSPRREGWKLESINPQLASNLNGALLSYLAGVTYPVAAVGVVERVSKAGYFASKSH